MSKLFVHDQNSHRIAHVRGVQEPEGLWLLRMAFTPILRRMVSLDMHRILVYGSTQTAEIMMLADSIQLDIPAIEEKSLPGIKLLLAETCSGCGYIHHLPI